MPEPRPRSSMRRTRTRRNVRSSSAVDQSWSPRSSGFSVKWCSSTWASSDGSDENLARFAEDVRRATGDKRVSPVLDSRELGMTNVDCHIRPPVEPERTAAAEGADVQEFVHGEDVSAARLAPRDSVELAKLLERIDPHVRVRTDAQLDATVEDTLHREKAVAEVRLCRRARADVGAGRCKEVEFVSVRMRRVDDRRPRA